MKNIKVTRVNSLPRSTTKSFWVVTDTKDSLTTTTDKKCAQIHAVVLFGKIAAYAVQDRYFHEAEYIEVNRLGRHRAFVVARARAIALAISYRSRDRRYALAYSGDAICDDCDSQVSLDTMIEIGNAEGGIRLCPACARKNQADSEKVYCEIARGDDDRDCPPFMRGYPTELD